MLIVRAEIWPFGEPAGRFGIGSIVAANESLVDGVSTYSIRLQQAGNSHIGIEPLLLDFSLTGHRRSDGVWRLVREILNAVPLQDR